MKKMMKVEGMHCAGCSGRLKRLLEALPAVESAAADHAAGTAEVTPAGRPAGRYAEGHGGEGRVHPRPRGIRRMTR